MQVMAAMSDVLAVEAACMARGLRVRTLGIVPLSPRLGLIQWVPDALPVSDIYRHRLHFEAFRSRGPLPSFLALSFSHSHV